jgi:hypothetical protein
MTSRRLVSVLIAVLASVAGLPLLWTGGAMLFYVSQRFTGGGGGPLSAPGALAMLIAGVLLCAVTGASIAWSSLGAVVMGALHVLVALLALMLPVNVAGGGPTPVWDVVFSLASIDQALSDGASVFTARGIGLILGFALIGGGLAAALRPRPRPAVATGIAAVAGALLGITAAVLAFGQGGQVFRLYVVYFDPDRGAALLLALAAAGFGVATLALGWSSLGAYVAGGILLVGGGFVAVSGLRVVPLLSGESAVDLAVLATLGLPQAVGALLIGLGFGAARRRRRAALAAV